MQLVQVLKVLKVLLEHRVQLVHKAQDRLVPKELQVLKVLRELQVHRVHRVHKELKVMLV